MEEEMGQKSRPTYSCCMVFLEKLVVAKLFKKFSVLHDTGNFFSELRTALF
jgi:hypothetical protein